MSVEQTSDPVVRSRPEDLRLVEIWDRIARPSIGAVSTDVFDTLVWREVPHPVDAFLVVAVRLKERGLLSEWLGLGSFGSLRMAAEGIARQRRLESHSQSEVTLEEIYELLPPWVFDGGDPLAAVEVELEAECELVLPDLDVLALLLEAQAMGKQIVAVSDTYFSASHIRRLLNQPGASALEFDRIFTSADHRVNKSGGLFDVMLAALSLEPGQVLHFGDNAEADVSAPAEAGIETAHFVRYPAPFPEIARRERPLIGPTPDVVSHLTTVGGLTAARTKALSRPVRGEIADGLRPYWDYGANVLGPVFTGFAEWIVAYCEQMDVKRVFCLMREGAFLGRLIENTAAYLGHEIEATPLWLNRKLCLRAAVTSVDAASLADLLSSRRPYTVAGFLRVLGLDPADVPLYATQLETRLSDPVVLRGLIDHLAEQPELRSRILGESRRIREAVVSLIEQRAPSDEPLTLVDLGWGATIQGKLTEALADAGSSRHTVGLYLLTSANAARQVAGGAEVHGFLGDYGPPDLESVLRSPELLEQVCMPPHGSQLDLDERLQPLLADVATSPLQRAEAEAVRAGIVSFQSEWMRHRSALRGRLSELGSARSILRAITLRSVVDPTPDEVAAFGSWHHDATDDPRDTEPIADATLLPRLRYMEPDQLRRLPMRELYWPFGLAAQVDEYWPPLLAAATAGEIPWESMAAPLETGEFSIEASGGIGTDDASVRTVPRRNRFGLSSVSADLSARQITELTLRPATLPCVIRVDWIDVACHAQGSAQPIRTRFGPENGLAGVVRANCYLLGPNILIVHGTSPSLTIDIGAVTRRVVSRIEIECAFAVLPIGWVLPSDGRVADIEAAEQRIAAAEHTVRDMQSSLSWRITAPLRAAKRRLR